VTIASAGTLTRGTITCGQCKRTHATVADVQECYAQARGGFLSLDDAAAEQAAECWAENYSEARACGLSDWDAKLYANVLASGQTWAEYLAERDAEVAAEIEAAGECEHGLSAALCCGPGHYPPDTYTD
jgi:hypothetical protein